MAAATAASRSRPQDTPRTLAASRSLTPLALADGALSYLAARLALSSARGALALAQVRKQARGACRGERGRPHALSNTLRGARDAAAW